MLDNEEIITKILMEFGLDSKNSHIVNGHVPVELKKGESPIKCGGKLLIIDGGFSKAYQGENGDCRLYVSSKFPRDAACGS